MDDQGPRRAWLSLGSNLGERIDYLRQAVAFFEAAGVRVIQASSVYETEPVGGPPQGPYLNAVIEVLWLGPPEQLLTIARAAETEADRIREVKWGPRTLDVDLIAMDRVTIDGGDEPDALTLPHPRAHERAFVIVPLAEIAPTTVLAPHGTAATLLMSLPATDLAGVRLTSLRLQP